MIVTGRKRSQRQRRKCLDHEEQLQQKRLDHEEKLLERQERLRTTFPNH